MPGEIRVVLRVVGGTPAESDRATASLEQALGDLHDTTVPVTRVKEQQRTLDGGATLVVLLGAPAAVKIVQGIVDWLHRWRDASVEIEANGTRVTLRGEAATVDVQKLVEALVKPKHK